MEISKTEMTQAAAAAESGRRTSSGPVELMGAEILVRALQAEGVKHLWGYPGGAVLYIYDALYKQESISTCWCATSRRRCMRPTAMRAPPETWAWRWSRPARV